MNARVPAHLLRCTRSLCTPPKSKNIKLPEPPLENSCCGTGCANCVWFEYGNQLVEYYSEKNKERVLRQIEQQVPDPNVRAFVLTELRMQWKT